MCNLYIIEIWSRSSYWIKFIPLTFFFCLAVVCPKLTVPDNGGVVPSSCSQADVEYGTRCVFYCGDGYALRGPRYTRCQDDTSWSEIAPLSCVRGQFISMQGGHYKLSQTVPTVWSNIFSISTNPRALPRLPRVITLEDFLWFMAYLSINKSLSN